VNHPVIRRIHDLNPQVDFWSARTVETFVEELVVRQNVLEPVKHTTDKGLMITVFDQGGFGYAATPDISLEAIEQAFQSATRWAHRSKNSTTFDPNQTAMPANQGTYKSLVQKKWNSLSLKDRVSLLQDASEIMNIDDRIVDWQASLWHRTVKQNYFTSNGADIEQEWSFLVPNLTVTANQQNNTQSRSLHGRGLCRQGGLEILSDLNFRETAKTIAREAIELLLADNCPSGTMDLVLDPDQMLLQIHETIGHPIELDRILGDERNYAGTSFVSLDMFGKYQYGSDLLNITYDPTLSQEFASYAFDDDGVEAKKKFLIQNGLLVRPLGGASSQARSGLNGVANARACSWNRPAIDRMANINLEPGTSSFSEMVKTVEKGVFMKTNTSWSIDDSRNKFQFGCEWAQLIENGTLTRVIRNPNYRGISATFWRNLKMVGDKDTFKMYGSPFCGKGEPNQAISVGHASPACLFSQVDVFGGV
jgi:predicted Zn-dependent protease